MANLKIYHYALIFINLIIVAYMYILIAIKYKSLPDEIPSHYNFKGEIDSYAGKGVLFMLPIVSTFVTLIFISICFLPERFWKLNIGLERIEMPPEIRTSVIHLTVTLLTVLSVFITAFLAYTLSCMIYSMKMSVISIILFIVGIFSMNILFIVLLLIKIKPLL